MTQVTREPREAEEFELTIGPATDGRRLAIISRGGHPQRLGSGTCEVLDMEVVDGWGRRKIDAWFERKKIERPWETRQ
jgi:hypothetical protein